MDNEFYEIFDRYADTFGDIFPMEIYNISEQEAIKRMKRCLKEGKPAREIWTVRKNVKY